MAKPKYLIAENEFRQLRERASLEYYELRVLEKPKTKSLTPLAKNVHNIRLQRKAHERECANPHYINAKRISKLREKTIWFRNNANLYKAERLSKDYHDIIAKMTHSSIAKFMNAITRISTVTEHDGYILDIDGWHVVAMDYSTLEEDESGKWMCFFKGDNYQWAKTITEEAIVQGVCECAKCSLPSHLNEHGSGVICLYGEQWDYGFHKRCTQFMIDHNMIQKTKNGTYYNISFKMNWTTSLGIYGTKGKLKLSDLRDLKTGEWIHAYKEIDWYKIWKERDHH